MKKLLLFSALLLQAGTAFATQFKVICCDGTVVYCQGLSLDIYKQSGVSKEDYNFYKNALGNSACEHHGECYRSITELPNPPIVQNNAEEIEAPELLQEQPAADQPLKA